MGDEAGREPNAHGVDRAVSRSDREYPARPILGVGAVVVRDGKVLVVKRGAAPGYGQWSIPGGAVELGESVREATRREVREECGVEIDIRDVVEVVDRVVRDPQGLVQFHFVLIDFAAGYVRGRLRAGSDVLAARWVPITQLMSVGLPDLTLSVVGKALRQLGVVDGLA